VFLTILQFNKVVSFKVTSNLEGFAMIS